MLFCKERQMGQEGEDWNKDIDGQHQTVERNEIWPPDQNSRWQAAMVNFRHYIYHYAILNQDLKEVSRAFTIYRSC